jgi:sulfite reductase alpha subunit-like flavoprotein
MKDYMDKVFSEAGVTDAQMTTNTYRAIKQVVQDRPDVIIGTELGQAMKEAAALANELKARKSDALMRYISDSDLKNAVACFNSTLTITQEVFGEENMTEAVICKAIEAGSYIAYRAIMGEAQQPSRRY